MTRQQAYHIMAGIVAYFMEHGNDKLSFRERIVYEKELTQDAIEEAMEPFGIIEAAGKLPVAY